MFDVCTLGAARIASSSPVASASVRAARIAGAIVINELDAHGVPQDWVELKNIAAVTCTLQS